MIIKVIFQEKVCHGSSQMLFCHFFFFLIVFIIKKFWTHGLTIETL